MYCLSAYLHSREIASLVVQAIATYNGISVSTYRMYSLRCVILLKVSYSIKDKDANQLTVIGPCTTHGLELYHQPVSLVPV